MFKIIIKDSNWAFAHGLRYCFENVLAGSMLSPGSYISSTLSLQVDIIFQEIDSSADCPVIAPCISSKFNGIVFYIMESARRGDMRSASGCLKSVPVIFRDDSLSQVRDKVLKHLRLWRRVGYDGILARDCAACGRLRLTENEINVIRLLSRGLSLTETAWVLGKNVKTVFTQKKSAMNKLKLKTSRELFSFIIKHRQVLCMM